MMQGFFEEKLNYEAVLQFLKKDYPELQKAKIVITDKGDDVLITVVAIGGVIKALKGGAFEVHEEQFGDFCKVSKSDPISKFFESLREMLEAVSKTIKEVNKDVKA